MSDLTFLLPIAGLIVAGVIALAVTGNRDGNSDSLEDMSNDAVDTAAMRVLMREHGLMHLYTQLGSPPEAVKSERARIQQLREKVAKMPSGRERRAYERWLNSADRQADEAEQSWTRHRAEDAAHRKIARP